MTRLAIHACFALASFAQTPTLLERADEAFRLGDIDSAAKLAQQVLQATLELCMLT